MNIPDELRELALEYRIQLEYYDAGGIRRFATPEGVAAVLRSLGVDINGTNVREALRQRRHELQSQLVAPVLVAWDGRLDLSDFMPPAARLELRLEDGGSVDGRAQHQLPLGYHELDVVVGERSATALIISAPRHAYTGGTQRTWGVFLPLYSLRSPENTGMGDFRALRELMRFVGEAGGSYVSTLPLLAAYLDQPFEPSPYAPVSRLYWNEAFLDVRGALQLLPCAAAEVITRAPGWQQAINALNSAPLVDYREVARRRRQVLEPLAGCHAEARPDAGFDRFLALYPGVRDYAAFRAATEHYGLDWHSWPEIAREGQLSQADFAATDADYHTFVQYLAHRQLADLAGVEGARLYLDLPIGVHGGGYDVWRFRDVFARGASAGAPPDAFFTGGQNWGFPPLNPFTLRATGYRYLREALRTHLRYAGALRLDHVMALHRLFWIPDGARASDGVYVRYEFDELYAVLCLESARHQALIVGEDLGTVPPEVRERMHEHKMQRMYVVQFEADPQRERPLAPPPENSVASLNTHDMPPFAAYCAAGDADIRVELGILSEQEAQGVRAARAELLARIQSQLQEAGFLHHPAEPRELSDAMLGFLAASDARMLLINLEDLWAETLPQNVPGTGAERPNWQRVAQHTLEQITSSPEINATLKRLHEIRREK